MKEVLHVDDYDSWVEIVSRTLIQLGYTPISGASVSEARGLIEKQDPPFEQAVLDNRLGDGTGAEIAALLRAANDAVRIIGLSTDDTPWANIHLYKVGFDRTKLAAALESTL